MYEIVCFRQAPGVYARGIPTEQFSWLTQYTWQITLCKQCRVHLGWLYTGPNDCFFGLIKNRLLEQG